MRHKSPRELEDEQRLAERAADWFEVLQGASAAERAEFCAWIRESPRHLEAFLYTTAVARAIREVDPHTVPVLRDRLAAASQNVVPIATSNRSLSVEPEVPLKRRRRLMPWAWAASLLAIAVAALVTVHIQSGWRTYSTTVGEQRAIELEDRSSMQMNGLTRLQVRFSSTGRDIRLLEGEALFDVVRDPARPFRVYSGASLIQAVGTRFNVLHRSTGTVVAVVEGTVQISPEAAKRPPEKSFGAARIGAGEEARIAPDGHIEKRAPINVVDVSTWRQRRLVFRADTLTDVITEFNRHNRAPRLVVEGDVTRARRYSGVFDANDPGFFIAYLREDSELELEERENEFVIRVR